jgi:hypothetical protein
LEYNNKLKLLCKKYKYNYIDITNEIIDTNNIINKFFLNKNPFDHHLDQEKTYNLYLQKLKNIL